MQPDDPAFSDLPPAAPSADRNDPEGVYDSAEPSSAEMLEATGQSEFDRSSAGAVAADSELLPPDQAAFDDLEAESLEAESLEVQSWEAQSLEAEPLDKNSSEPQVADARPSGAGLIGADQPGSEMPNSESIDLKQAGLNLPKTEQGTLAQDEFGSATAADSTSFQPGAVASASGPIDPVEPPLKSQTEPAPSARGSGSARRLKRSAETPLGRPRNFDGAAPPKVSYRRRELSLADRVLLVMANVGTVWKRLLRGVRSQLPSTWQAQLPDEILSAVLLGVFFLLLALWNPLGGSKAVTVAPAPGPALTAEAPAAADGPADDAPKAAVSEPEEAFDAVESRALEVSPEQTLIADIQDQVANITQTYAAGLIQSVRVNFQGSTLKVNLGSQWYDLTKSQQEQLAQDVFLRSQALNFGKLYLFDAAGALVARNPVVGSRMVILQNVSGGNPPIEAPSSGSA